MSEDKFKVSKKDMEMISLGLNEYINYVNTDHNSEDYTEIESMLNRLNIRLNEK